MLSKEAFVRRILDGTASTPKKASKLASPSAFSADDVFGSKVALADELALIVGEGLDSPRDDVKEAVA